MLFDGSVDCIEPEKRYVYIFDFMCIGTELKIVSVLINSKTGILKVAIRISRYKKSINVSLSSRIEVLLEQKKLGIEYLIAGSKEELQILKSDKDDE